MLINAITSKILRNNFPLLLNLSLTPINNKYLEDKNELEEIIITTDFLKINMNVRNYFIFIDIVEVHHDEI